MHTTASLMRRRFLFVVITLAVTTIARPTQGQTTKAAERWPFSVWAPYSSAPIFAGTGTDTWDRKIRERGFILIDEKKVYHLWYTGYNDDRSKTKFLGHATSQDGIRWVRDPKNPIFDKSWVEDVCVVHVAGKFYMFAEGKDDIAHLLTSTDGVSWTEQGALDVRMVNGEKIKPGPYGTPTAFYEDGTWNLLYERMDAGVWLARSKDLKTWVNVQDEPVLALGPDGYDKAAVAMNQVIKRDGVYYALYHATATRPWKEWTTCLARSKDLIHWEKCPTNPIISNNCSSGIFVQAPEGLRIYTMHPDVRLFIQGVPASSQR